MTHIYEIARSYRRGKALFHVQHYVKFWLFKFQYPAFFEFTNLTLATYLTKEEAIRAINAEIAIKKEQLTPSEIVYRQIVK